MKGVGAFGALTKGMNEKRAERQSKDSESVNALTPPKSEDKSMPENKDSESVNALTPPSSKPKSKAKSESVNALTLPKPPKSFDADRIYEIPHDKILPWKLADRSRTEVSLGLQDLMEDIAKSGQSIAALVRPISGGRFELIYGHRRWAACQELNRPVRCLVRNINDEDAFAEMVRENNDREDISIWSKCASYSKAMTEGIYNSHGALAVRCGLKRSTVSAYVSLYKNMPNEVSEFVNLQLCSVRVLRALSESSPDFIRHLSQFNVTYRVEPLTLKALEDIQRDFKKTNEPKREVKKSDGETISGELPELFSVRTSKSGGIVINILKNGRAVLSKDEISEALLNKMNEKINRDKIK